MKRWIPPLTLALALICSAAAARADALTLPDSTRIESWTLPNGLRVVLRDVPSTDRIAVVLAFDTGWADDPAGREGLAQLLGEIRYFGAFPGAAARTRADLASQRPAGWEFTVDPRLVRMSETATLAQFPGVIHQVAARLRGAPVDDKTLKSAVAAARVSLAASWRDSVGPALATNLRLIATGAGKAGIDRYAGGAGLQKLNAKDVNALLAERCGPANAVLSLAGNFATYPVRRIIESEFGAIPAGGRPPARAAAALDSASLVLPHGRLVLPYGGVGVFAPALTDSSHASFYAAMLVMGGVCLSKWGRSSAGSSFYYSIYDDPQVAQFNPPLDGTRDPLAQLDADFQIAIGDAATTTLPGTAPEQLWRGVDWLLGGPMPPEVIAAVREPGGGLGLLASTGASRELTGGEAFWSGYRTRFKAAFFAPLDVWIPYATAPAHRAEMVFVPASPKR